VVALTKNEPEHAITPPRNLEETIVKMMAHQLLKVENAMKIIALVCKNRVYVTAILIENYERYST